MYPLYISFAEDTRYVLNLLGIRDPPEAKKHMNRSPGGSGSSVEMAKELFQTLSRDEMSALIKLYKFDFEAFGYNLTEFDLMDFEGI